MGIGAVLDADVLVPMSVCDTLVRLAAFELYDPYWSTRIFDEVRETSSTTSVFHRKRPTVGYD
jgi:hypothetical protein